LAALCTACGPTQPKDEPPPAPKSSASTKAAPRAEAAAEPVAPTEPSAEPADTTAPTEPAEPPAEPAPEPFTPESGLALALPDAGPFERTDESLSESGEFDDAAVFRGADATTIAAAWFPTTVAEQDVVVLLRSDATSTYEYFITTAHVLARDGTAWKVAGTSEVYGDVHDPDRGFASIPELVELGAGHRGLWYRPVIRGCGGGPCKPEDDYVVNVLHEVTPSGLVEVLRFEHLSCEISDADPYRQGCSFALTGPETDAHRDIRITTRQSTKHRPKPHPYTYRDGKYVSAG
jgi:hypothetical protein